MLPILKLRPLKRPVYKKSLSTNGNFMRYKQARHHPKIIPLLLCISALCTNALALADDTQPPIPMQDKGAHTYYIKGQIRGLGATEFMVDTGSGYVTINEHTLEILKSKGEATYVKDLRGILADGQQKIFPVYRSCIVT